MRNELAICERGAPLQEKGIKFTSERFPYPCDVPRIFTGWSSGARAAWETFFCGLASSSP